MQKKKRANSFSVSINTAHAPRAVGRVSSGGWVGVGGVVCCRGRSRNFLEGLGSTLAGKAQGRLSWRRAELDASPVALVVYHFARKLPSTPTPSHLGILLTAHREAV